MVVRQRCTDAHDRVEAVGLLWKHSSETSPQCLDASEVVLDENPILRHTAVELDLLWGEFTIPWLLVWRCRCSLCRIVLGHGSQDATGRRVYLPV